MIKKKAKQKSTCLQCKFFLQSTISFSVQFNFLNMTQKNHTKSLTSWLAFVWENHFTHPFVLALWLGLHICSLLSIFAAAADANVGVNPWTVETVACANPLAFRCVPEAVWQWVSSNCDFQLALLFNFVYISLRMVRWMVKSKCFAISKLKFKLWL